VNPSELRASEKDLVVYNVDEHTSYIAIYDLRYLTKIQAVFSLLTTVIVIFILGLSQNFATKTNNTLLIHPIETMILKVQRISENPVKAAHQDEDQAMKEEENKLIVSQEELKKEKEKVVMMETRILDMTLTKVGGLLALGFGEAGSEIICKNILDGSEVDPFLPGQKTICIFGSCQIQQYAEVNSSLESETILFVNTIGAIVHGIVYKYSGSANKNLGDTFLIIWKFVEDDTRVNYLTGELELLPSY
jgi:hypothetical protein